MWYFHTQYVYMQTSLAIARRIQGLVPAAPAHEKGSRSQLDSPSQGACVTPETQRPTADVSQVPHQVLFGGSYCTVKLTNQGPQIRCVV